MECPNCFPDTINVECPLCRGNYFFDSCCDDLDNDECQNCHGDGDLMDRTCEYCQGTGKEGM